MNYIGEHVWVGELGRFSTALAFAMAIVAVIAFYLAERRKSDAWRLAGRWAFRLHGFGVFTLIASLFVILTQHYFEYDYAWKHSSLDLPMRYILSAFWEGQEGSFLLWTFWHVVLGLILMHTANRWEASTMLTVSLVQAFLLSMVLGIYIGDIKIGSTPFVLIRELPENIGLPWTNMPDYLQRIPAFMDGNGLNPLLQNYWMTIHPPVLFLGFASTLIPFAFALAGLWTKEYVSWTRPALPWSFFGVMILGVGILMGGAWAYEALSFGGFWAWDPVENSSLVPWITLVGAAHLMLIYKNKGGTLKSALALSLLSFLLILYSTFLTRSGVLGDTSVHAFVDLGLSGQLLIYLLFFIVLAMVSFFWHYKKLPSGLKEDDVWSREFWMFVGALTLLASAFQISFSTSIPVWNRLFGPEGWLKFMGSNMAPPLNAIEHYNKFQIPFAIIITLLMSGAQFLRYKKTEPKMFFRNLSYSFIVSIIFTGLFAFGFKLYTEPLLLMLLLTAFFAVFANLDFWIRILKGNARRAGASLAHIGFALIMLGALISAGRKQIISENSSFIAKDFPQNENILLELNDTLKMGEYYVSWKGERKEGNYRFYDIDYLQIENGIMKKVFQLSPTILENERMGNSPEPDTKHYIWKDIYTHVTYAPLVEEAVDADGFSREAVAEMEKGDTAILAQSFVIIDSIKSDLGYDGEQEINRVEVEAKLIVINIDGNDYIARPKYILDGDLVYHEDAIIDAPGLKFRLDEIKPESGKMVIKSWRRLGDEKPFIVLKAMVFPLINVLWLGCLLMAVGTFIAVWTRIKSSS